MLIVIGDVIMVVAAVCICWRLRSEAQYNNKKIRSEAQYNNKKINAFHIFIAILLFFMCGRRSFDLETGFAFEFPKMILFLKSSHFADNYRN